MPLSFDPGFDGIGNQTTSPTVLSVPAGDVGDTIVAMVMTDAVANVTVDGFILTTHAAADAHKVWAFTRLRDGSETDVTINVDTPVEHAAAVGNFPAALGTWQADIIGGESHPPEYEFTTDAAGYYLFVLMTYGDNSGLLYDPADVSVTDGGSVNYTGPGGGSDTGDLAYFAAETEGTYTAAEGTPVSLLSALLYLRFTAVINRNFWLVNWQ